MQRDRVHEMCLTEADAAIKEQRIVGCGFCFCDTACGSEREFVRLADDEILESEARIERCAQGVLRRLIAHGHWMSYFWWRSA